MHIPLTSCVIICLCMCICRYFASEFGKNAVVTYPALKARGRRKHALSESSSSFTPPASYTASTSIHNSSSAVDAKRAMTPTPPDSANDMIIFDDGLVLSPTPPIAPSVPPASTTAPPTASTAPVKLTFDPLSYPELKEPVVGVEKDNTHFEALPRIPLSPANLGSSSTSEGGNAMGNPLTQLPSTIEQVEECTDLVHFSRNGHLLFSAGHVDGSVYIREIDGRTGFIVSAGDFMGHRHRVTAIASDFISGSQTDVIATCDAYGQVLVWTVSLSHNVNVGKTYIISRRPQRMFRSKACLYSSLDLSWQMGVVVATAHHHVRVFSIEREELLKCIDISTLFLNELKRIPPRSAHIKVLDEHSSNLSYAVDQSEPITYARPHREKTESSTTTTASTATGDNTQLPTTSTDTGAVDNNGQGGNSSGEGAEGEGSSGEALLEEDEHASKDSDSTLIIKRVTLCDDGYIILHVQIKTIKQRSTSLADDTLIDLTVPTFSTPTENSGSGHGTGDTSASANPANLANPSVKPLVISIPEQAPAVPIVTEYLIAISLSGYQTGRVHLPIPLTFLDCVGRGDVVVTGFLDGRVTLYTSQNLVPLYSFYPWRESICVYATYPSALHLAPAAAPVICIRLGPSDQAPAVLCASTTMVSVYTTAVSYIDTRIVYTAHNTYLVYCEYI